MSENTPPDEAAAARTTSRRRLLALGGAGLAAAAVGIPVARKLRQELPPRVTIAAADPLRIDGVTVIDPSDGSRRPDATILVRAGRIVAVLDRATAVLDRTAEEAAGGGPVTRQVAGAGRFVVPGFRDMHTHALQADNPRRPLAAMLAEGVTGIRQMAGSDDLLALRAESRLPLDEYAPQLLTLPGAVLTPFRAGSAGEAYEEIDRQRDQGADFIKIVLFDRDVFLAAVAHASDRGLTTAGHLPPSVSPAEASAAGFTSIEHLGASNATWIACSSRALTDSSGLPVPSWVLDAPFAERVFFRVMDKRLINPAAYDSLDAVAMMRAALESFDESRARRLAATLAANRTWQVPTLVRLRTQYLADAPEYAEDPLLDQLSDDDLADYHDVLDRFKELPEETRATYRMAYQLSVRLVGIFHEEGVPMMTGTDGGGRVPGQTMREEFTELAHAGLPPLSILRAATTAPATFLGDTDRAGRVAPGMDADFVLLDGDPLIDAGNLSAVSAVVRAGHYLTRAQIQAYGARSGA
ncbi:amidohydrolase family protein [Solwaraspora sp. WMMB335]|uniref:amidohydrolase family protein n=1 Tax=Solwaraspora sp. WMMB335 TaxID=3404118 RepID=UPI003B94BF01